MVIENIIIVAVVAAIIGLASLYIYKAKKSGKKCIGCSAGGSSCSGCAGGCGSCSRCGKAEETAE